MRLVFMGTPDFAVPTLKAIARAGHEIAGVFTQPDRPSGRGRQLKPSAVKIAALELELPVFQPERIKTPESLAELRKLQPDCIIVVAYGQILSQEILDLPPRGCINVHASLLPLYRGAAPIHWAVIHGEKITGVTTMLMDAGLDTGDVLLKKEIRLVSEATTGEIHDALALLGAELLIQTLREWEAGRIKPQPQSGDSSYAPLLKRKDEEIDWTQSAAAIHDRIRGLNPWPGAYTYFRGESVKVWGSLIPRSMSKTQSFGETKPGEVLQVTEHDVLVNTGEGLLCLTEVQPAGKRIMSARAFFLGRHGETGEVFGSKDGLIQEEN